MSTVEELTRAVQQAAGRMVRAEFSAQFEAARREHDQARALLEAHLSQHSDD